VATVDFDEHLIGEPPLEDLFKKVLREHGLSYDEQSRYIWLPKETEYETLYSSEILLVTSPLPIYLIVSKAVKAPEKNKSLVRDAIVMYGDELLHLLEKYEVPIHFFLEEME
jgi:hypothetical protein